MTLTLQRERRLFFVIGAMAPRALHQCNSSHSCRLQRWPLSSSRSSPTVEGGRRERGREREGKEGARARKIGQSCSGNWSGSGLLGMCELLSLPPPRLRPALTIGNQYTFAFLPSAPSLSPSFSLSPPSSQYLSRPVWTDLIQGGWTASAPMPPTSLSISHSVRKSVQMSRTWN